MHAGIIRKEASAAFRVELKKHLVGHTFFVVVIVVVVVVLLLLQLERNEAGL